MNTKAQKTLMFSERLAEFILPIVSVLFGENTAEYLALNSHIVLLSLIAPVIVGIAIWLIFDFLHDSWKMPIALGLELLSVFFFLVAPFTLYILAFVVAAVVFLLTKEQKILRWFFVILSTAKVLLLAPILSALLPAPIIGIIAIAPIITILMIIACITD
jgi:hypothetical protein